MGIISIKITRLFLLKIILIVSNTRLKNLTPLKIGGAIYISLPSVDQSDSWNYLGYVSNEKPSGTFKIDNLKRMAQSNMESSSSFGQGGYSGPQIGVSVKSLNELANLTPGKLNKINFKI